jgi:hypothetical protein
MHRGFHAPAGETADARILIQRRASYKRGGIFWRGGGRALETFVQRPATSGPAATDAASPPHPPVQSRPLYHGARHEDY